MRCPNNYAAFAMASSLADIKEPPVLHIMALSLIDFARSVRIVYRSLWAAWGS